MTDSKILTCKDCENHIGGPTMRRDEYGRTLYLHSCEVTGESRPEEYETMPFPPRIPGCVVNGWARICEAEVSHDG